MAEPARDLLIEIGTEELPASELKTLGAGFARSLTHQLDEHGLAHEGAEWFAAPRRLAVRVTAVAGAQTDETVEHRGPPVSAAFDEAGTPTKAATGFAQRHGVGVDALERRSLAKAVYLFVTEHRPGRRTAELLPELVDAAARALPARKRMRWGAPGVTFPRPIHWVALLWGEASVAATIMGVAAGRETHGHRFHHPAPIALEAPVHYEARLLDPGWVIAGFDERRRRIHEQVIAAAGEAGGTADADDDLLDDVASLVEWPVALAGRFDRRFLDVPAEALVAVMKDHQKYFPVRGGDGALMPVFVTVANIASAEPETVRAGNERVIEPRLADAEFFWQQDRKHALADRLDGLAAMVFQRRLGTLYDRSARVAASAAELADAIGADPEAARDAGWLAKCDLLTEMVGELPELQGIMGGYYAQHEGYGEAITQAIADHYRPAFAGDELPRTPEGRALALADRLDVLVGIFAVGQGPTGDKDPFALRRAALGALRILIEGGLDLDLEAALTSAARAYDDALGADEAVATVRAFMTERLRVYYTGQGFGGDLFEAVAACAPKRPLDLDARLRALRAFRERPESASLVEANKRIRNILRKSGGSDQPLLRDLLDAGPEYELARRLDDLAQAVPAAAARRDYQQAFAHLAELAAPLDRFFDQVMVMTDDERLRANRIALLADARALFGQIAD
ncbi:MAG: glycine--tRNA ligase subunit beta, partial [Proteobacteria bacterium SW_6_67_9]